MRADATAGHPSAGGDHTRFGDHTLLGDLTRPISADRQLVTRRGNRSVLVLLGGGVLLALLAAMFVLPVQAWLRQRDEISVKEQQLSVLDGANAQLTDEIEHLQTTEGAKEAARDELGVVGLGEQRTSLLPADLTGVALPGGWPYDAITQVVAVRAAATAPPPEAAPSTPAAP
jgi:cell division protein FtsB